MTASHRLLHLEASLNVLEHVVHFKGATGHSALQDIACDIGLLHGEAEVFMVLVTGSLGFLVDVTIGCYIEQYFAKHFRGVFHPRLRIIDLHTVIYLECRNLHDFFPEIHESLKPRKIIISISNRGSIIMRMTWRRVDWTQEAELMVLALAEKIASCIKECV